MTTKDGIRESNPGWMDRLRKRWEKAKKEVAVGFPAGVNGLGNPHYEDGASIVEVAAANNFGHQGAPARRFMELGAKKANPKFRKLMRQGMRRVNKGDITVDTLLQTAGLQAEADIRDAITTGPWAPNSPETIARKKSSKPLIDTGDMRKYVTSQVRNRGGVK